MRPIVVTLLLLPVLLIAVACSSDVPFSRRNDPNGRIVRNDAPPSVQSDWIISASTEAAFPPLQRIVGMVGLSAKRVAVADAGTAEIILFDSSGAETNRFGGRGDGPSEFRAVLGIDSCMDSLAVVEPFEVTLLDLEGIYGRRIPYRRGGERRGYVAISDDCRRILVSERASEPAVGEVGVVEDRLVWIDGGSSGAETVAPLEALEAWTREFDGSSRPFSLPWGTVAGTAAYAAGAIRAGHGRATEFTMYPVSPEAEVIRVQWRATPSPITAEDRAAYEAARARRVAELPPEREVQLLFPDLDELPALPPTKPHFDRILADRAGRTWIRSFPPRSFGLMDRQLGVRPGGREEWAVFDAEGGWIGIVRLPEGFALMTSDGDRLLGVHRDSLDVETAQVLVTGSAVPAR